MSIRKTPLVSGEIYHIVNRGVASQPIFSDKRSYKRFIQTMIYYQNQNVPLRFSYFSRMKELQKSEIFIELQQAKNYLVETIAYCLMPNHIHLLLKQLKDKGIIKFVGNLTNSYCKYFNAINKRSGSVFQGRFRSVRIETNEQLLHVNRYVHLNPYSGYVVKTLEELKNYSFSSLPEYLDMEKNHICQKSVVLDQFRNTSYEKFVFDQADYQQKLQEIKHLILE